MGKDVTDATTLAELEEAEVRCRDEVEHRIGELWLDHVLEVPKLDDNAMSPGGWAESLEALGADALEWAETAEALVEARAKAKVPA